MNDRLHDSARDASWPLWNHGFDRDAHLALCAGQLELLRRTLGDKWRLLGQAKARQAGIAEAKNLTKGVIRVASESVDFYATVDFITHAALDRLDAMRSANGGRPLIGHLTNSDTLTHEHMVPGTVVMNTLIGLDNDAPILPVLEALSFRALVSQSSRGNADRQQTDAYLLDVHSGLKSKVPPACATAPFRFWPLMRYEAAGLLEQLIPVTDRARTLLADYRTFQQHG